MDRTMTVDEVKLAMRIIGLRGTRMKATKNYWDFTIKAGHAEDVKTLDSLERKGFLGISVPLGQPVPKGQKRYMFLNNQGIQQLKQQIGEFHF